MVNCSVDKSILGLTKILLNMSVEAVEFDGFISCAQRIGKLLCEEVLTVGHGLVSLPVSGTASMAEGRGGRSSIDSLVESFLLLELYSHATRAG